MNQNDACLKFSVQIRQKKNKYVYPVEDSSIIWDEKYIDVGYIHLFGQSFDNPKMNNYCENLKFSPWNTLPEHRPLGRINRARRKIYKQVSDYRHKRNGLVDLPEPTNFSIED